MNLTDPSPDLADDTDRPSPPAARPLVFVKEPAMSPASRTVLCATDEVAPDFPLRCEHAGVAYAVFQIGDAYHVTADLCSHGPGSLSEGEVEGCEVVCPFHQGRFDIRTGAPTSAPCTVAIRTWTAIVVDGHIEIDPGEIRPAR